MSRYRKSPLRPLAENERQSLLELQRALTAPAAQVARAKALLAVAEGHSYLEAARAAGRRSGDAVAALVARFNAEGLSAVVPRHGGGQRPRYTAPEREQILAKVRCRPEPAREGSATWSISLLRQALRREGLPRISRFTIWNVLREVGLTWQRQRTWCETGTAQRQRQRAGQKVTVQVSDPDTEAKKN
jgi:transposase